MPAPAPSRRRRPDAPPPEGHRRRGEAGGAFVLVLLVLLVLSAVAASLLVVSATEMRIGANERSIERSLAAAEAGVGMTVARILVAGDYSEGEWGVNAEPGDDPADPPLVGSTVAVAPALPLVEAPCTLCEINAAGTYGSSAYARVHVAVTARGRRGGGARVVAERTVSAIVDLQPVQVPASAYYPLAESSPEELAERVLF